MILKTQVPSIGTSDGKILINQISLKPLGTSDGKILINQTSLKSMKFMENFEKW